MIRTEPIIAVKNVEESSRWYQRLLGCQSMHGGDTFEILADTDGTVLLCLHRWGEHDHPTMTRPLPGTGHGLILYFRVQELGQVWQNAVSLKLQIEQKPHLNPNSGKRQFSLRDPDKYYLIISG
ncbi:glyoxalase [Pedobacter yulinensis]|uniref:Glyoxalase n=1 Tax=Pedobacter yulinensis TaxID=2126353 RepID=A0A2T3HL23_9SPHI|nr:VOC family protein [Pedobacter yulinensis]PST83126.1 glyoxalase [Pedobacter yulinensis]